MTIFIECEKGPFQVAGVTASSMKAALEQLGSRPGFFALDDSVTVTAYYSDEDDEEPTELFRGTMRKLIAHPDCFRLGEVNE